MTDWTQIILNYYQIIQNAIQMAKIAAKIKNIVTREYTVDEIRNGLLRGDLHFGDKINLIGTFSEFVPFIDPKMFLKGKLTEISLPHTARLEPIDDVYCGAFFKPYQTNAFAEEVLPLFYGIDSKVLEHYTGEMLDLSCQIIQIPVKYQKIINQNRYFSFDKEENFSIPFGLKVLCAEPYGLVDSFKINQWIVGELNPAPHFVSKKEKSCFNCNGLFSYMTIDPLGWPLRYGCNLAKDEVNNKYFGDAKQLIASAEHFNQVNKEHKPYVLFPSIFSQFEIFYPSVDILNTQQNSHSRNILLGAVHENLETLLEGYPGTDVNLILPKEATLIVNFQYDQVNQVTRQSFNPIDVPKWECPNYAPDPKKIREQAKQKTTEKFKICQKF